MPAIDDHLSAVSENLRAYEAIPQDFPGWRAVVLFYAAVHLVEALFAVEDNHSREHSERDRIIRRDHGAIWKAYSRLKQESLKARYLTPKFSLTAEQVYEQLRKKCIRKIEGYVKNLLPSPARTSHIKPESSS